VLNAATWDAGNGGWAHRKCLRKPVILLTDFEVAYINNQSGPYFAQWGF